MELYSQLFKAALEEEARKSFFPEFEQKANEMIEKRCYRALVKIRFVLNDNHLDDAACFKRIEEIVCIFENMGSSGGCRHDF